MSEIVVSLHPKEKVLVVDSRLVAIRLGVNHSDWIQNIVRKYQTIAEEAFGILRFENGEIKGRGQPEIFAWLTEEQATFYMTLSKNTLEVVECKVELVKAFFTAKKLLEQQGFPQGHTSVYIKRLENMIDHKVPDDVWTTFREGAEILLLVEKEYKVPVDQMDLCDGSIGSHWRNHRLNNGFKNSVGEYIHKFRDKRGKRPCNAYSYDELPIFRRWLREVYIPVHLPEYLVNKFGKRAVRQIYEEQELLTAEILELTEEKRKSPKQEEMHEVFLAAREAMTNRYLFDT